MKNVVDHMRPRYDNNWLKNPLKYYKETDLSNTKSHTETFIVEIGYQINYFLGCVTAQRARLVRIWQDGWIFVGQKLAAASLRGANFTFICLLYYRRRHGDHLLGTMHTKRGFCLGWLNMDTFLEKCEGGVVGWREKNSILKSYI